MNQIISKQIQSLIDLETQCWDEQQIDLFLDILHPDMVWPWPPSAKDHDPETWVLEMGRFDRERWRASWQSLFASHDLIHNHRKTVKILISKELDGALAVVDIDTLWKHKVTGEKSHWLGRVCKIYTKMPEGDWKFYFQTGALDFSIKI